MLVVCDAETLAPVLKIPGHASVLAFSPDGTRIVAGQMSGDVKVFDARSGAELLTLRGHTAYVSDVAFSSDGQRLVTTAADGTARTWETAPINRAFIKSPSKEP
jgi:WD40 repeat protein